MVVCWAVIANCNALVPAPQALSHAGPPSEGQKPLNVKKRPARRSRVARFVTALLFGNINRNCKENKPDGHARPPLLARECRWVLADGQPPAHSGAPGTRRGPGMARDEESLLPTHACTGLNPVAAGIAETPG